jgi:hypothetical protein
VHDRICMGGGTYAATYWPARERYARGDVRARPGMRYARRGTRARDDVRARREGRRTRGDITRAATCCFVVGLVSLCQGRSLSSGTLSSTMLFVLFHDVRLAHDLPGSP